LLSPSFLGNIAFVLRHELGPTITADQISFVLVDSEDYKNQILSIVYHRAPKRTDTIFSIKILSGDDVLSRLNHIVQMDVRFILHGLNFRV
jgi:hypothetical protein